MSYSSLFPYESRHAAECARRDHPPVTYNPWSNATWCKCGEVIRDGQYEKDHWACCGDLA